LPRPLSFLDWLVFCFSLTLRVGPFSPGSCGHLFLYAFVFSRLFPRQKDGFFVFLYPRFLFSSPRSGVSLDRWPPLLFLLPGNLVWPLGLFHLFPFQPLFRGKLNGFLVTSVVSRDGLFLVLSSQVPCPEELLSPPSLTFFSGTVFS